MARLITTIILGCLCITRADAGTTVEGVRAWAESDHTRIVLDMSANAPHHLFTLKNPNRVVVDISGGDLADIQQQLPSNVGVVKAVRIAQRNGKDLRIVLDLDRAISARSFYAGPARGSAERLVIDLGNRREQQTVKRATAGKRDIVIAIDPGHGGHDPGAIGKNKTREKDVVLAIAHRLAERINREEGFSAFLTRNNDVFVQRRDRMEVARRAEADLFISVHADAFHDRRARGSGVYALSLNGAENEANKRLADSQNQSFVIGVDRPDNDPLLASVLMDLSQNATIRASLDVGSYVLEQIGTVNKLHRPTVQQAGFTVLLSPDVPSILVETAFISNPDEERKLSSSAHQKKIAGAIFEGVRQYFYANAPAGTLVATRATGNGPRCPRNYEIGPGDTLSGIADRCQISVSRLRRENQLANDRIRVGQVLRIPAGG
ncbi:MAG: N-acetylmuramoyl-L-alanine amidase [Pseudomonadota bacterium]